jgi:nitric oxide dioxygenase
MVRNSFEKIESIASELGSIFYNKLFEMAPETRSLFSPEMAEQHSKFMSVVKELVSLHLRSLISLPVTLMNDSEAAMPAIHSLGKRHTKFGVTPAHFDLMRAALMDALADVIGDEFTPELRDAWESAFDVMANVMKKGLLDEQPAGSQFLDRLPTANDDSASKFMNANPSNNNASHHGTNK